MSCRTRCGSCASRISAARCSLATTAAKVQLLHRWQLMLRTIATSAALAAVFLGPPGATGASAQRAAQVNANAATIKEFLHRVDGYVALHKKLEDSLPSLPKQTDPRQIDTHQRE